MPILPALIKFLTMGLLSAIWLVTFNRMGRLVPGQTYHLEAERRDRRKARFYVVSVWMGLGAAFLSFGALDAFSNTVFESSTTRAWVLGAFQGVGMWGVLVSAAVWAMVGQRASRYNMDGTSLTRLPDSDKNRKS